MHRLAIAAIFVSAGAFAQVTPPGVPDTGFFRPTPTGDPSLTHPPAVPPAAAPQAPPVQPAPPVAVPVVVPVEVPVVNGATTNAVTVPAARAEVELTRAEREAAEAQARARAAPAPIPGSFTGLTSERDR